jgi:hypothetical protein
LFEVEDIPLPVWLERRNHPHALAPKGNDNPENPSHIRFANMGATLFTINHFKPDVERITEDDLLSFLRHYIVLGQVENIRIVPTEELVVHAPSAFLASIIIAATL